MNIMFGSAGADIGKTLGTVEKTVGFTLTSGGGLPGYVTCEAWDSQTGSAKKKISCDGSTGTGEVAWPSYMYMEGVWLEDGTELTVSDQSITSTAAWSAYTPVSANASKRAYLKYQVSANASTIVIDGNSFPGTYYVTGDTYARSDVDGNDQFFQFIIPKAKMQAENTITLEAEGDPSVFNMSLKVLRPDNGEMMKLVQYDLTNTPAVSD